MGTKVNWKYWNQIPRLQIWQAVVLICGEDPEQYESHGAACWDETMSVPFLFPSSYQERVKIACANIGEEGFPSVKAFNVDEPETSTVLKDEFLAWAISKKWDMPSKECAAMAKVTAENTAKPECASNPNKSEKLTHLNQAAAKFWGNVDPSDKTTYPKNEEIRQWLEDKGYSERQSGAAASIIRPPWAEKGRIPEN